MDCTTDAAKWRWAKEYGRARSNDRAGWLGGWDGYVMSRNGTKMCACRKTARTHARPNPLAAVRCSAALLFAADDVHGQCSASTCPMFRTQGVLNIWVKNWFAVA